MARLQYLAEQADSQLAGTEQLILAGARSPVSFFAYPGRNSDLVPAGCQVHTLADWSQDVEAALAAPTIQALWTQARERLDVTTVLIDNAAYAILRVELERTGAGGTGDRARRVLDLSDAERNWVPHPIAKESFRRMVIDRIIAGRHHRDVFTP